MTGPRSKKESATDFIPTPDKQSDMPSGFCMTGHHDNCKYVFIYGKCGCDCHTQTQKTQTIGEKVAFIADSTIDDTIIDVTNEELIVIEDPRPWIKQQEEV